MKAANFQWFYLVLHESIDVSVTAHFVCFISWNRNEVQYNWGFSCLNANEKDCYRWRFIWASQQGDAKSECPNRDISWNGEKCGAKYSPEEQWRVFAYYQRREEYKESLFDNMPMLDTLRKSVREVNQNDECCYSCFKTR